MISTCSHDNTAQANILLFKNSVNKLMPNVYGFLMFSLLLSRIKKAN